MRRAYLLILLLCVALGFSAQGAEPRAKSPSQGKSGVERTNYLGWNNSYILSGSAVRAVVVPAAGGRIFNYSLNGQNVLFEGAASHALTSLDRNNPAPSVGYQCDIGPEIRPIPEHTGLWLGPYTAEPTEDFGVELKSSPDGKLGVQLEKEIMIDPESGDLGITQRMRNVSNGEISFCLWDRTLCQGGGFAFFPLKKKSQFSARWSIRRSSGGKYSYDGRKPESPNVKLMNGVLVAKCEGETTKIGADSEAGWIAYVRGRWLFIKYFPYSSKGLYTDGGNSVELYFDRQVAELEPLSPEVKVKKGETYDFPEKWTMIELDDRVGTFAEARALVQKIPPSPFE
jgi:hypothetical protein